MFTLKKTDAYSASENLVIITKKDADLSSFPFTANELDYINKSFAEKQKLVQINQYSRQIFVQLLDTGKDHYLLKEDARQAANKLSELANKLKLAHLVLVDNLACDECMLAYAEGIALSSYQFLKYFKDKDDQANSLKEISILSKKVSDADCTELQNVSNAVFASRDLINEPLSYLTAVQLSKEIKGLGEIAGLHVEVFDKRKIEALKMGGLLAVNKGSIDPPTFTVIEWKPENAKNEKPVILVGKGVVYDSGGLSLKPTKDSMDYMKSDMSGAAGVIGAMYATAMNKLPIHVIALIPATDNRPDGNAYVPGDVVNMHNGMTVEVLNTDAEGRMLLADALSYAQKYDPELVIDMATLTGAAAVAVGKEAIVGMGKLDSDIFTQLKTAGEEVYERIVEFPLWDEYDEYIKSTIADVKNIGGRDAGAITAGKFLQRFTNYPWVHLDIAGSAFLHASSSYRGKGGIGVGVRLLHNFLKNY